MNEYVADGDWNAVRRNFQKDQVDTGGRLLGLRGGAGTVTWPGGSQTSSAVTVDHGLGRTPTSIQLTPIASATPADPFVVGGTVDDASFDVEARTTDGSSPAAAATQTFYWLAIG